MKYDVLGTLQKLPEMSMVWIDTDRIGGLVHRGVPGYTPFPSITSEADVAAFNERHGVTEAQAEAMHVGSMFGWHIPGADPDQY